MECHHGKSNRFFNCTKAYPETTDYSGERIECGGSCGTLVLVGFFLSFVCVVPAIAAFCPESRGMLSNTSDSDTIMLEKEYEEEGEGLHGDCGDEEAPTCEAYSSSGTESDTKSKTCSDMDTVHTHNDSTC
mmetsp:Transcript_16642/g.31657  ORF Transcript_16642/g.31657 Transcript_16642/m.31657 type:complete len:131 (+) Transcript_16642:80-472(+)|eukprot:scaffold40955_cov191-Amphora_coffeaeformis.AAC.2